jgi:hypothetical protein
MYIYTHTHTHTQRIYQIPSFSNEWKKAQCRDDLLVKNKYMFPERDILLGSIIDINQTSKEVLLNFAFVMSPSPSLCHVFRWDFCKVSMTGKGSVRHYVCHDDAKGPSYLWLIGTGKMYPEANPLRWNFHT